MKRNWWIAVLAIVALVPAKASLAQASVYVEGSADYLNGGPYADFLYGGTAGALLNLTQVWHDRITLSADLQTNVAYNNSLPPTGGYSNGEGFYTVTFGPRLALAPHYKLAPYVQANVGFARYNDPTHHAATDTLIGGGGGVTRQLTPRLDAVLDYSYSYFGYNFGYYSPQAFSLGVVFHFAKR